MSKLRSISTSLWSDPFIEELEPDEKLLFIYLITNEKTNMLGIYEASTSKMSFETGIKKQRLETILKAFEGLGKVRYTKNYVILVNFLKHQNFNINMKKSAIDVYNNLPKELKNNDIPIDRSNPLEGFETLCKRLGMLSKIEVEYEIEDELELEEEEEKEDEYAAQLYPTFDDFWNEYDKKVGKKEKVEKTWNKLKQQEKEKIMLYIPAYKKSQPDKKYRKNPSTFLNNESWNDELIFNADVVKMDSREVFQNAINSDAAQNFSY